MNSKTLAPPNSVLLIADINGGEVPTKLKGAVASTGSCIAVGCKSEVDGKTEVIFGHRNEMPHLTAPDFEGTIATPGKRLAIFTVAGDVVLESPVRAAATRVSVWLNDPSEPDRVIVSFE